MAIKPIAYLALVKPDAVQEVSKGGIILSMDKRSEERAQVTGTIIALGEDFAAAFKPKTPFWGLKPGDKVYFAKYAGKWVQNPDSEDPKDQLLFLRDEDIVGVQC